MPVMIAHTQGLRFARSESVWDQPIYWSATLGRLRVGINNAATAHR